jgi:hypothetical protein
MAQQDGMPIASYLQPLPCGNSQVNPTVNNHAHAKRTSSLSVLTVHKAQLDHLSTALHLETTSHNRTRESLAEYRSAAFHWERGFVQEQFLRQQQDTVSNSLQVKVQDAEMGRVVAEERLRNLQADFDQMTATIRDRDLNMASRVLSSGMELTSC